MEKKTGLNFLIENLMDLGLKPNVHTESITKVISGKDKFRSAKSVVAELSDSQYFLAHDTGLSHTHTGIYSLIDLPEEAEYEVHKRDWFDFLIYPKRQKVGIKYIDNNITIVSSVWVPSKELNKENVSLLLQLNKTGKPYKLIVKKNYSRAIEQLRGEKVIGIVTNDWLYKKEDFNDLLDIGSKIIGNIKNGKTDN